ncbi:MAG: phosphoglucosamine mutase [Coraliomargaritaceae bacterium]
MGKYFGTDGIRGRYGEELIHSDFAYRFGAGVGARIVEQKPDAQLRAVIGHDTRESSTELVQAIAGGLRSKGFEVQYLGVVPTPGVAMALLKENADVGVAVTASHNPASDNGYKLFDANGCKLSDSEESAIEALIDDQVAPSGELEAIEPNTADGASLYIDKMSSLLPAGALSGWKIVLDLANGATSKTSPEVFRRWGAEIISIGDQPDGMNINAGVGSEFSGPLGEAARVHGARLGIAHDGDGDRIVVCDETGTTVDGDVLLGMLALHALKNATLTNRTLVATIQSNLGLDFALKDAGGQVVRADVGDRNVAQMMRSEGSNIGGESSGHIIFSDHATTGDGLLAAAKLIELMMGANQPLSQIKKQVRLFPQKTANLIVEKKIPLEKLPNLQSAINKANEFLGQEGRVLIRYSGTEPKLRILAEGRDLGLVNRIMEELIISAKNDLVVIGD